MRRTFLAALGLALVVILPGCGGEPTGDAVTEDNKSDRALSDVGEMYRQYTFEKKKPPTSVADFAPLQQVAPLGMKALQDGAVVARAGVVIQDVMEGPANTDPADEVMAYAKEVPASGGAVLMHNRTIRHMTAEEFKSAKLAGTGDMAAGKAK